MAASLLSTSRLALRAACAFSAPSSSASSFVPRRHFNLHEFQSKSILDKFGVKTQPWALATTPAEAHEAATQLASKHNTTQFVVKAQIHAGGRGVGTFTNGFKGGVHLVDTPDKVRHMAEQMLGQRLVTKQTSADGVLVNKLMIAHALDFKIEYYLSFVMDREAGGPCLVFSPDGGMDIENVARDFPEMIMKVPIPIETGMTEELARSLAYRMGFTDWEEGAEQLQRLYTLFIESDCSQLEINPWAQTPSAEIYAIDAKLNFDESAKFRQEDIFALRDPTEEDPREVAASKVGLNYIGMDGTIGCMVNGAGLAMATMDEIKLCGGSPANFLDVGGGATEEQVANAFRIITSDPKVDAILINIFGGIMRCDVIANGIVNAAKTVSLKVPMVVRLAGTNSELGAEILKKSGLAITSAADLHSGAQAAVQASKSASK